MIDYCIVCAGGTGSRLGEITKSVNKHLLPISTKPAISHVMDLAHRICNKVFVVTSPNYISPIATQCTGAAFVAQRNPNGIVGAMMECEQFTQNSNIAVLLADNLFDESCRNIITERSKSFQDGAEIFAKKVANPEDYGVVSIRNGKFYNVEEKPKSPSTDMAMTGAFLFDSSVWNFCKSLECSQRGEYEISDLVNCYGSGAGVNVNIIKGEWSDIGASIEQYWKSTDKWRNIL